MSAIYAGAAARTLAAEQAKEVRALWWGIALMLRAQRRRRLCIIAVIACAVDEGAPILIEGERR